MLYDVKRGVAQRGTGVAWTDGVVPYTISTTFGECIQFASSDACGKKDFADPEQRTFLIITMQKMERLIAIDNVACIRFRPKTSSDRYYILIFDGNGCSSYVSK